MYIYIYNYNYENKISLKGRQKSDPPFKLIPSLDLALLVVKIPSERGVSGTILTDGHLLQMR